MLTVRLSSDLDERLDRLAKRTGRSKSYYAREALVNYLDDLEDVYLAESRLEAIRAGREETHPLSDLIAEYAE